MHQRHSTGGVRKQRGRWIGLWYENGIKKSRTLGLSKDMTKGDARVAVSEILKNIKAGQEERLVQTFGAFVEETFIPFFRRKWKRSTCYTNVNRIKVHLVKALGDRPLDSFRRDGLQDFLDRKAKTEKLSYSIVAHLRWDLKQIFDMAVAEGLIRLQPAIMLFTPREARKPVRRSMAIEEIRTLLGALELRERLIAKLAILAGMRPGEIFALTWDRTTTFADIRQRIYQGDIDTPKSENSLRKAALSEGLLAELEQWRAQAVSTAPDAWVFASERMTPLHRGNWWKRAMKPALEKVGMEWATFQIMRRTHSTMMKELGADPKLIADQMGHTLDVNQNVYTQSSVELRAVLINTLERYVGVK